ncbi:MAG: outer membrane lipoprotein-sorting protein [Chthoniobacterales bacterium]|nr:outer membrane lipoprotein-sorting protein [Chthoniobacterales bacterium]
MKLPFLAVICLVSLISSVVCAEEPESLTAPELAAKLASAVQDGNSAARARFSVQPSRGGEATVLQVQIKSHRDAEGSAVAYEVQWPAGRKGERFVISQRGTGPAKGASYIPPDRRESITSGQLLGSLLGTDLAFADAVENFFLWKNQTFCGREQIGGTDCVILESKPGAGDSSPYGKVRSWIDPRRMVALRVEKSDKSGRILRRIDSSQIVKDDVGRYVPATMTVRRASGESVTEIDGSNLRHDVRFAPADFEIP